MMSVASQRKEILRRESGGAGAGLQLLVDERASRPLSSTRAAVPHRLRQHGARPHHHRGRPRPGGDAAFRDGAVQPTGTAITKILPPVSRFAKAGGHSAKKRTVLQKLGDFFDRFFGLS